MEVGSVPSQGSPGMAWPSGSSLWLGVRKAGLARATGRLGEGSDLGECSPGPWGLEMGTQLASNGIFASVAAGWKGVRVGGPSLPSSLAPAPTLREGRAWATEPARVQPVEPRGSQGDTKETEYLGESGNLSASPLPPNTAHPASLADGLAPWGADGWLCWLGSGALAAV